MIYLAHWYIESSRFETRVTDYMSSGYN